MADIADRAHEVEEAQRADALHRQRQRAVSNSPASADCEDCGERIPAQRRRALPGCLLCVDCQTVAERNRSLVRG